jgi:hypothetical protein
MKNEDLIEHRAQLNARLEAVEAEKTQLVRKLKAVEVLLEGNDAECSSKTHPIDNQLVKVEKGVPLEPLRRRSPPAHAVRVSPRSSLIGAVQKVASEQPGEFDSSQILTALQSAYPEFKLTETKHISSPLSDLTKRGVLVIERKRIGTKPNIYRVAKKLQ